MYLISQNFVSLRTNSSDMKRTIVLSTMAMLLTMACMAQQQNKMVVKTESGLVKGIDQEGSMGFLGIPYARVERFMPPQPVKKWKGVRVCDHWGPMTMQQTNRPMSEDEMSEQCCVLNVWTTDLKAKKPVMFWLHGGGFDSGTSAWDPGMCLAKKDVVVVSINHRLNILGFLDLSTCGKNISTQATSACSMPCGLWNGYAIISPTSAATPITSRSSENQAVVARWVR